MASPVKVLKDFFGVKPGDSLKDFAAELKELTDEDKAQLVAGIEDETFDY